MAVRRLDVRTRIVRIGNSQGVRIPKPLLEQAGLDEDVELVLEDGAIVIRNLPQPRRGWAEKFRTMSESGDDLLLDEETASSRFDDEEWDW